MIVAGGSDEGGNYYDTTETLTVGQTDWKVTGSLPHRFYMGRMMSSNNVVYYIGSIVMSDLLNYQPYPL